MLTSLEARVTPRISRLEHEVTSQSEAMAELRDCSLQSERSIQRLLAVLERAMGQKAGPADAPRLTVMTRSEQDEPGTLSRKILSSCERRHHCIHSILCNCSAIS